MEQYIVRYQGKSTADPVDLQQVRSFPGIHILDETPRMLLIAATSEAAAALKEALPEWLVSPEQVYAVPSPRPAILQKASVD